MLRSLEGSVPPARTGACRPTPERSDLAHTHPSERLRQNRTMATTRGTARQGIALLSGLVIWADAEDRDRLRRLKDAFRPGRTSRCPVELTRPKARPEQKRGRGAQPYCEETDAGLVR
jgi:hypothetical protein